MPHTLMYILLGVRCSKTYISICGFECGSKCVSGSMFYSTFTSIFICIGQMLLCVYLVGKVA